MIQLTTIAALSATLLLSSAPSVAAAPLTYEKGAAPCKRNCGQTTQTGDKLLVTLIDKAGKPFKVESYPIDPSATRIAISPAHDDAPLDWLKGVRGPVTTRTASATITTPTQQVVISQIFYYSKGQLVDVRIVDQRFAKDI